MKKVLFVFLTALLLLILQIKILNAQSYYSKIYSYNEYRYGWAKVKAITGNYGFIDTSGREVVPTIYKKIYPFNQDRCGWAKVKLITNQYTFIDENGKDVLNDNAINDKESSFVKISPLDLHEKIINMIANEWLLVTAGNKEKFNMMTASWGQIGNLWGEPVFTVFIRPQRYTYEFMENSKYFTVTVFAEQYRDILNFCGTKSGRDYDKIKETGLEPVFTDLENVYYRQARLIIECEKIYAEDFKPENFINKSIPEKIYSKGDFHRMYIGKIVNVWVKEE